MEFADYAGIIMVDPRILHHFARHPETLLSLTPRQFEELVAELLDRLGYRVILGPKGRDSGVDIFASREQDWGAELVLVQCKRYALGRKVGEPVVKQLHTEVFDRSATRGLVATTSYFSTTALDYIHRNQYRLSGKDNDSLREWISALKIGA